MMIQSEAIPLCPISMVLLQAYRNVRVLIYIMYPQGYRVKCYNSIIHYTQAREKEI
jgi:hypothetical protein